MFAPSHDEFEKLKRDYKRVTVQFENADMTAKKFKLMADSKVAEINQLTRECNLIRIEKENLQDSNNDLSQVKFPSISIISEICVRD
jgi:hypothetical protein